MRAPGSQTLDAKARGNRRVWLHGADVEGVRDELFEVAQRRQQGLRVLSHARAAPTNITPREQQTDPPSIARH
eukprot:3691385-Rhodomonas_salina.2